MVKEVSVRITWGQIFTVVVLPVSLVSMVMHYGEATEAVKYFVAPMAIVCLMFYGAFSLSDPPNAKDRDITGRLARLFTIAPPEGDELVSELDTLKIVVAKANMQRKEAANTIKVLDALRKRIQKEPSAAVEVVELGFLEKAIMGLHGCQASDSRIIPTFNVINVVLNNADARRNIASSSRLVETSKTVAEFVMDMVDHIREDTADEIRAEMTDCDDCDNRVMQAETVKRLRTSPFSKSGHKCLISLGILASAGSIAQTRVADAGGIAIVVDCLRLFRETPTFVQWTLWCTVNLIMDHAPNKKFFVDLGGLEVSLATLKAHPDHVDVQQIGAGMLFTLLQNDSQAKMNLPNVRQAALAEGIVDVVQHAKGHFPEVKNLVASCEKVLDVLISDYS